MICLLSSPTAANNRELGFLIAYEDHTGIMYNNPEGLYGIFEKEIIESYNGSDISSEIISIDGIDTYLISFDAKLEETTNQCYAAVFHKGKYYFSLIYFDLFNLGHQSRDVFLDILNHVCLTPESPENHEQRLAYAAYSVFQEDLISSCYGTRFPSVRFTVDASSISARKIVNLKTLEFLKIIREYRDTIGMDFEDMGFFVYADVMDVYGNTNEELVLRFDMKAEDIDKINFERIPADNIPKIAYNWYDTEILQ